MTSARKNWGIATPVCALVRNDSVFWAMTVIFGGEWNETIDE